MLARWIWPDRSSYADPKAPVKPEESTPASSSSAAANESRAAASGLATTATESTGTWPLTGVKVPESSESAEATSGSSPSWETSSSTEATVRTPSASSPRPGTAPKTAHSGPSVRSAAEPLVSCRLSRASSARSWSPSTSATRRRSALERASVRSLRTCQTLHPAYARKRRTTARPVRIQVRRRMGVSYLRERTAASRRTPGGSGGGTMWCCGQRRTTRMRCDGRAGLVAVVVRVGLVAERVAARGQRRELPLLGAVLVVAVRHPDHLAGLVVA